ncbi:MAG: hypothetical protein R3336_03430 [Phycisphaeraceae bacterium]|nr:hypothetical protein [Phycisphaeraceae bacterium]
METSEPLTDDTPPPRALAQGTGLLMQVVGVIFFLTGCCVCSISGSWDPVLTRGEVYERLEENRNITITLTDLRKNPGRTGVLLSVIGTGLGGLAMAGFGLGLQSDRRHTAPWAFVSAAGTLVLLSIGAAGLWSGTAIGPPWVLNLPGRLEVSISPIWIARLVNGLMLAVTALLTILTVLAWREHRQNPPPAGPQVLPPDFDYEDPLARSRKAEDDDSTA